MLRRPALLCALFCAVSCNPKSSLRQKVATIEVDPNPILFQPLAVGKTAAVTVQVKNVGTIDLHLAKDPYVVESDNDGLVEYDTPAMLARDCAGSSRALDAHLTIVPGDCAILVLRYAPLNTTDKDDARLVFESDDPEHPTLSVPVSQGPPPHLQVCTIKADGSDDGCDTPETQPPPIEFGMVAAGQNKTNKVRLKNAGSVPLGGLIVYDPAGVMSSEFARSANAPTTLAVGGSVDITLKFTPAGGGARTGSMQVDSADPTRPTVQIPLRGITAGPALCVDPSPLDFGKGTVGSPTDKTVTLTSCGNATVHLQQAAFDMLSSAAFSSPALPGPQAIGVGQKISFIVHFAPDDAADQRGAILLDNDAQADQYLTLLGSAVLPPTCRLEAGASSVSFGQVVRGQSAQRTVTVANRGAADCSLTAVKITAGDPVFSVLSPPAGAVTLRPGDAFTAIVAYQPPSTDYNATDTGTLEFDSDDPLRPALSVSLTGSPVAQPVCKVSVSPTATGFGGFGGRVLQFGNVVVGKTKTLPITVSNIGSANCTVGGIKFVNGFGSLGGTTCFGGTSCGEYKVVAPSVLSPLPPGQTTQINIAFSPKDTNQLPQLPSVYLNFHGGDSSATSECGSNFPPDNSGGCIDVGMSGQGDISNLEVIPSDVNFGLVTLGCKSKTQAVTLYNTGNNTPIHVQAITLDPATAPFYLQAPPTPFTINPGQKLPLQVTYKPSQAAVETATLKIQNDASNTTSNNPYVTVGLKGTGTHDRDRKPDHDRDCEPDRDRAATGHRLHPAR
jgi:hypothetical protein